jgi:hypothetical protein
MDVGRPVAIGLCGLTFAGGGAATYRDVAKVFGKHVNIAAEVGATRGSLLHSAATGGFATLDWRSRVEPGERPARHIAGARTV